MQVQTGKHGKGTLLKQTYAIALWPLPKFLIASPVMPGPYEGRDLVSYHQPDCPVSLATVLSRGDTVAYILLEGQDFHMMEHGTGHL